MKFFENIVKYKYPIMVGLCFLLGAICVVLVIQGMKKDHSLDMTKQRLELKEESRLQIEKMREPLEQIIQQKDRDNFILQVRDSLAQQNVLILNTQLDKLSNRYNEKAKVINGYGSDDLREYFRNLPKQPDNDY
jgi:hypothetical protein